MDSNSSSERLSLPGWLLASRSEAEGLESRLTSLFLEMREPLFRYVLVLLRNATEAEDISQECFLRLYQELRQRRRVDNVKAWLFRAGHNLAVDRHRMRETRTEDSLDHAALQLIDDRQPSSEEMMLRQERLSMMRAAVDRLSTQQRTCLHLRTEGFRYREIAGILEVSESTVCENIRRGLARLTKDFHER